MWRPCRPFWMLLLLSSILLAGFASVGADNAEEDITIEDRIRSKKEKEEDDGISHGLGNHIAWVKLEEGLIQAKDEDKPLMLIIHKSWCGACRALKPLIKNSLEIGELSKKFVMVNTMDDDEPEDALYKPDGGYIPRVLFFNPDGELLKDVINEGGNPKYKYFYSKVEAIMTTMNKVIEKLGVDIDENEINVKPKIISKTESTVKSEL